MQISFERSGGFIGVPMSITLDTATLPADDAAQLSRLVEAADFFNLPANIPSRSAQPDRFQYKVTVWMGDRQHTVSAGESAVPGTLKPLLDWLIEAIRSGDR